MFWIFNTSIGAIYAVSLLEEYETMYPGTLLIDLALIGNTLNPFLIDEKSSLRNDLYFSLEERRVSSRSFLVLFNSFLIDNKSLVALSCIVSSWLIILLILSTILLWLIILDASKERLDNLSLFFNKEKEADKDNKSFISTISIISNTCPIFSLFSIGFKLLIFINSNDSLSKNNLASFKHVIFSFNSSSLFTKLSREKDSFNSSKWKKGFNLFMIKLISLFK